MSARRMYACAALALLACGHGSSLRDRAHDLAALTQQARERGAYRCAPEELARAEAELEFADRELAAGDRARASEHLVRADANARAALRLSEEAACATPASAPQAVRRPYDFCGASAPARLSLTQPTLRRGSTKEHAAI